MITLTIDNKQVEVAEGTTVLEAAQKAGIYIPTLCYHPALKPFGGCRLCLVDIEKMRGPITACTTPATNSMVVKTNTPQLQELRRGIMELILTEHPHLCLICDRKERCDPYKICLRSVSVTERCLLCPENSHCELQRLVDYVGIKEITLPYKYKDQPIPDDPLIRRDYNLCVLCGRCVQMCQDVRGIGAISFINRGSQAVVGTAFDRPLKDSGCRFCGACVEVCPTGALMDRAVLDNPELEHDAAAVPCRHECPAGINVPLYVYLTGKGKYQDALAVIREKVPFPATLGRVCIHPCEQACRRGQLNEAIAIKELKRFVADRDTGEWKKHSRKLPATGKKVAIVGSGPAGLTAAYYLAELGHSVTVFEALSRPGGMMRVGIPDYRLPPEVLDSEVDCIRQAGVDILLNKKVESLDGLLQQGYEAVFVAVGAHRGMKAEVPGEDSAGVMDGATFLRRVNLGEKVELGERVAVVGGGNVAMDSARVALRIGAREVKIVYRRGRDEMPASAEEVEAALEEGIEIIFLASPVNISRADGKLRMTCVRMKLGEPDASGRRRPEPVKGSEFTLDLDSVIMAIGQVPDVPAQFKLKTGRGNTIEVDKKTMQTRVKGVWAGGDAATGPASVIAAIASGRRAAMSIDKYLGGAGVIDEELTKERQIGMCVGPADSFVCQIRTKMPCMAVNERTDNFSEVELGLSEEQAIAEGKRCFQCGVRLQIPAAPMAPLVKGEPEKVSTKG